MNFLLAAMLAAVLSPFAGATGVTAVSFSPSTGTALVVVATVPQSFWGIEVSSSNAGDRYKCWDSTSTSGLTFASPATLEGYTYQVQGAARGGPNAVAVQAYHGVVCAMNGALDAFFVYITP